MREMMMSSRGTKRQREDPCDGGRAVLSRFSASSHCARADVVCGSDVGRSSHVADSGIPFYCVNEEGQASLATPFWLNGWSAITHRMADMLSVVARDGGGLLRADSARLSAYNMRSSLPRRVEVNVIRGDTGRRYCFTFSAPRLEVSPGAGDADAGNTAYRDVIVCELLDQVRMRMALTVERPWIVLFQGKNLQTESGAELLLSSLLSESCQRISLAIFCNVEA